MTKKVELSIATALSQMSPAAHLQANDDVAGQLAKLVQVVQGLDQKVALIAIQASIAQDIQRSNTAPSALSVHDSELEQKIEESS
ncbi:hypothetical protein PCANC_07315 [Puccinia coronata f. sp. avenae]|uniref:Uncharacterized protein n=1 Tax=Puccinia coronata f. sp. avenae TaxID=200324 RepID=A0A2N5T6J1_9BASI|nr:hypothetical protein PCANC_07315 [Puccinia coronata f. sp. avenae]